MCPRRDVATVVDFGRIRRARRFHHARTVGPLLVLMRAQHVVVHIILLLVNDFARQALRYVLCLTYPSCCRSTLAPAEVAAATGVPLRKWQNRDKYRPMYNAFPGCDLPVVYHSSSEGSVVIRTMKWGLIPAYTKPDEKPQVGVPPVEHGTRNVLPIAVAGPKVPGPSWCARRPWTGCSRSVPAAFPHV